MSEKNNYLIDIIIPAYKAQESIERTLASIVIQSIKDKCKVTIVNDADDIGYEKQVNRYKDLLSICEIKLDKNGGPGVARQYGINNTDLPYFTCIDADDTFASAFALEILLTNLQKNPEYHTAVGSFLEERENLQFIKHQQDLVWMFGKLYTRAFINKYNIRFNETRANEDNGFNTMIRLCSNDHEKIMFIDDIVYYWHFKEDSITRINNCEYSYNQSFPGYTENMIYAITESRKMCPFNGYIDMWTTQVMFNLYFYYIQTCHRDPRFIEQNYNACVEFYDKAYSLIKDKISDKIFKEIFSQVYNSTAHDMFGIAPEITIYDFLDKLDKEVKERNSSKKKSSNKNKQEEEVIGGNS